MELDEEFINKSLQPTTFPIEIYGLLFPDDNNRHGPTKKNGENCMRKDKLIKIKVACKV